MPPKRRRRYHGVYYHSSPPKILPMNGNTTSNSGRDDKTKEVFVVKSSNIRIWIHDKDIGKLTKVLWAGQGMRLRSEASNNPRVRRFLETVPHVLNVIKDVHQAAIENDLEILQLIMEPRSVPRSLITSRDQNGLTVMHKAAGLGHTMIIEYLVQIWPDGVTEFDETGKSPLHWAASAKNNTRCYNLLVQAGADEELLDYKMKTAAYYKTKPSEIDRSLLTVLPEAPRIPKDSHVDWSALMDESIFDFPRYEYIKNRFDRDDSIENETNMKTIRSRGSSFGNQSDNGVDDGKGKKDIENEALQEGQDEGDGQKEENGQEEGSGQEEGNEQEEENGQEEGKEQEEKDDGKILDEINNDTTPLENGPIVNGTAPDVFSRGGSPLSLEQNGTYLDEEENLHQPNESEINEEKYSVKIEELGPEENLEEIPEPEQEFYKGPNDINLVESNREGEEKTNDDLMNTSATHRDDDDTGNHQQNNDGYDSGVNDDDDRVNDGSDKNDKNEIINKFNGKEDENVAEQNQNEENDERYDDDQLEEDDSGIKTESNDAENEDNNIAEGDRKKKVTEINDDTFNDDDNNVDEYHNEVKIENEETDKTSITSTFTSNGTEDSLKEEDQKDEHKISEDQLKDTENEEDETNNNKVEANSQSKSDQTDNIEDTRKAIDKYAEDEEPQKSDVENVENGNDEDSRRDDDEESHKGNVEDAEKGNAEDTMKDTDKDAEKDNREDAKKDTDEDAEKGNAEDTKKDTDEDAEKYHIDDTEKGDQGKSDILNIDSNNEKTKDEKIQEVNRNNENVDDNKYDKETTESNNSGNKENDHFENIKNGEKDEKRFENFESNKESNDKEISAKENRPKKQNGIITQGNDTEDEDDDQAEENGMDNVAEKFITNGPIGKIMEAVIDRNHINNNNNNNNKNKNEDSSPTSALEIEGVVQGEPDDNQVQSEGGTYLDDESRIKAIIDSGDMEQLAALVLNGEGKKLLGAQSSQPEIQAFLGNVRAYMNKIRRVHQAARNGNLRELQAALDRRKFAIAKDEISPNGASPLHVATIFGHAGIVRYLGGRFPETTSTVDDNGRTALHYAATINDNGHFYNLLVHLGSNPKATDKLGNTAEFYRNQEHAKDIFSHRQLLKDFGADEKLEEKMLSDQVPDDLHSARRYLDDPDILSTLERCYRLIHEPYYRPWDHSGAPLTPGSASSLRLSVTNYLAKFLKRSVFDKIKYRQTRLDHNLFDVIWPAMKKSSRETIIDEDLNGGIIAPDFDVFVVFQEFLVPLIKDLHCMNLSQDFKPHPRIFYFPLVDNQPDLNISMSLDLTGKYIQHSFVECCRNLDDFELPVNLSIGQLEQAERLIIGKILSTEFAKAIEEMEAGIYYTMNEVLENSSEIRAELATSKLLIPLLNITDSQTEAESLALNGQHWPYGRGVFISHSGDLAAWINVQEHLRILVTASSENPADIGYAYSKIGRAFMYLDNKLHFRESYLLGCLTSRPAFLGTGLKCYAIANLPHLIKENDNLRHLCLVRGLNMILNRADGGSSSVRLVNMQSLGLNEWRLFQDYCTAVTNILQLEKDMSLTNSKQIAATLVKIFKRKKNSFMESLL